MTLIAATTQAVQTRLSRLGLSTALLHEAVRAGELERVSCTPFDPPSYPGVAAWALCTRRLRELLRPLGWRPLDKHNLPLTVDPWENLAIAVTSGSPATGDARYTPTTKYPKGPVTAGQVNVNRRQLLLFEDRGFVPMPDPSDLLMWLLLVNLEYRPRDEASGEYLVHCELSLPAEIDEKGFVTLWAERIILEPLRLDGAPDARYDAPDGDDELDIPVTQR